MQYVRSLGGSVSKTWNSINPANLSGAIDVIVVELEDGSLACSPFHVRFGKWSLLRPYEKKVEFKVNGTKQDLPMKLGEGGEAFFVFETEEDIPQALQTSPVLSPTTSPTASMETSTMTLQEPSYLDIGTNQRPKSASSRASIKERRLGSDYEALRPLTPMSHGAAMSSSLDGESSLQVTPRQIREAASEFDLQQPAQLGHHARKSTSEYALRGPDRAVRPSLLSREAAYERATSLSRKLSSSNIRTQVSDRGDIMLDMTGYKSTEDESLRAESIARKLLAEEAAGNYDLEALIGADESGNVWIYGSEEAKSEAINRTAKQTVAHIDAALNDAASDPGYQTDDSTSVSSNLNGSQRHRGNSENGPERVGGLLTPPETPPDSLSIARDTAPTYAKTLRLTSRQLQKLNLQPGPNPISFTVNRVTCGASMFYWRHDVPVVISDIDGTITKSDALGHMLDIIGRDWTHQGVAKLYSDIVANGYHIMYLTSRSIGLADRTRNYLSGVVQEKWKLPNGPVIMSPDRTIAALRREVWLRKPEVFKMACLRDILTLFGPRNNPFYAGFGNRLTDALSYRSVNIPSNRIFTINADAEVSLDMLTLNKFKTGYVSMREILDYFFPPITTLVGADAESFTDFNYWRTPPPDIDTFSLSDDSEFGEPINATMPPGTSGQVNDTNGRGPLISLAGTVSRSSMDDFDDQESSYLSESVLSGGDDDNQAESLMASIADLSIVDKPMDEIDDEDIDIVELAAGRVNGAAAQTVRSRHSKMHLAPVLNQGEASQADSPNPAYETMNGRVPDRITVPTSPLSLRSKKSSNTLRSGSKQRRPLLSPITPLTPSLTL